MPRIRYLIFWLTVLGAVTLVQSLPFYHTLRVSNSAEWVAHSHAVLAELTSVLSTLQDAETGERGFLITGEDRYLEPYLAAVGSLDRRLARLREMTQDNPSQQPPVNMLAELSAEKLAELKQTIDLRRSSGFDAAQQRVTTDRGLHIMDRIRSTIGQMRDEENRLLAQRSTKTAQSVRSGITVYFSLTVVNLAALGLCYSLVRRYFVAQRAARESLRQQSLHDGLTGLPNRQLFNDRLECCIRRAKRDPNYRFAVLFLDLDHFKIVNDSLGHAAGDRLLLTVAEKLHQCLRDTDTVARAESDPTQNTVARLGGDEFTVILDGLAAPEDAKKVAERILQALNTPHRIDGHEVYAAASIGIAYGDASCERAQDLVRDADAAMYRAKSAGKGRYELSAPASSQAALNRLRLDSELRRAVERGELRLHYQPIMSLSTHELVGFEALVRWKRNGVLVAPAEFVPLAEETGLIVPIGCWVLEEACRQLQIWHDRYPGHPALSIAVNVSRRQFADKGLTSFVAQVLARTRIDPASLKLEITESSIMEEARYAAGVLGELKALGVRLHMDDFGTGYSSLSCLHLFPIDALKIDRSFISNASGRRDYAAVLQAIILLARNLGAEVIAEGLETAEQVALLQALDCDYGQGYFFSKPVPAEVAAVLIETPRQVQKSA